MAGKIGEMGVYGAATDQRYLLIRDFHTGTDDCGCMVRRAGGACEPGERCISRVLASEAQAFMEKRAQMIPRPWGYR